MKATDKIGIIGLSRELAAEVAERDGEGQCQAYPMHDSALLKRSPMADKLTVCRSERFSREFGSFPRRCCSGEGMCGTTLEGSSEDRCGSSIP